MWPFGSGPLLPDLKDLLEQNNRLLRLLLGKPVPEPPVLRRKRTAEDVTILTREAKIRQSAEALRVEVPEYILRPVPPPQVGEGKAVAGGFLPTTGDSKPIERNLPDPSSGPPLSPAPESSSPGSPSPSASPLFPVKAP